VRVAPARIWGLPPGWGRWARRIVPVVVTPVVLMFAPHIYDNLAFLTTMIVYVVLAEGVNLLYGFTGYLPFGYVGFFGAGAYGAALSITYWHVPGVAALAIGGLVAAAIGMVFSPLLRLSGAYFALATLAASQVLYYIVANEPWTFGETGTSLPEVFSPYRTYVAALVIMALAIAFTVFVKESRFGLSLRAIRSDPVSASMAGINVVRTRSVAWFISAALAGLAGAVWAIMTAAFYAESPFALTISVYAIVFALFGGVRTVLGPVFGAVVLYSLYQYIGISNPQYFELVYGVLIVALVLFLPGGLSSLVGHPGNRPSWWKAIGPRAALVTTASTSAARTTVAESDDRVPDGTPGLEGRNDADGE
jgi:branched-chain amino acid transport system permease protein